MDFSNKLLLPPIFNTAEFSPPSVGDFRSKFCVLFKALRLGPVRNWTTSICVKSMPTGRAQCVPPLALVSLQESQTLCVSPCFLSTKSHRNRCNAVRLAQHLQTKTCFSLTVLSKGQMASPYPHSGVSHPSGTLWLTETTISPCNTKLPRHTLLEVSSR